MTTLSLYKKALCTYCVFVNLNFPFSYAAYYAKLESQLTSVLLQKKKNIQIAFSLAANDIAKSIIVQCLHDTN